MPETVISVQEGILTTLRRIMRTVDLHSKRLEQVHGITGPQLVVLRELDRTGCLPVGELAVRVNLSHATVTGILDRLSRRGYAGRERSTDDKRKVLVSVTQAGREILNRAPPLLQEKLVARLGEVEPWEQTLILSSLQRIVAMMEAESIEASPHLASGPLDASPPPAKDDSPIEAAG